MRLTIAAALFALASIAGCCHDTCDCCRDIGSCLGSQNGPHLVAAPVAVPAPAAAPMPAAK